MKVKNVRTGRIAELKELSEEELLDYWHPYEPEYFSPDDIVYVYEKIKKYVKKLTWKGLSVRSMEELKELIARGQVVYAELENGLDYILTDTAIGHPLLTAVKNAKP